MASVDKQVLVSFERAPRWAESLLRTNHLNTLVQREIGVGHLERATILSERARRRARILCDELIASGARKPEGYCESDER